GFALFSPRPICFIRLHAPHGGQSVCNCTVTQPRIPQAHQALQCEIPLSASSVGKGDIDIRYVPTRLEAADGLTKPLGPAEFFNFTRLIGMDGEMQKQSKGENKSP